MMSDVFFHHPIGVVRMSIEHRGLERLRSCEMERRHVCRRHLAERKRRSNPARGAMDCFASLAMTGRVVHTVVIIRESG
jgi:hypothetical protein